MVVQHDNGLHNNAVFYFSFHFRFSSVSVIFVASDCGYPPPPPPPRRAAALPATELVSAQEVRKKVLKAFSHRFASSVDKKKGYRGGVRDNRELRGDAGSEPASASTGSGGTFWCIARRAEPRRGPRSYLPHLCVHLPFSSVSAPIFASEYANLPLIP